MPQAQDPVISFVLEQLKKLNPQKVILFGSRARGDFKTRSDYDFAISVPATTETAAILLNVQENAPTLCGIDIVNLDEVSENFKKRIHQEGVVLYERPL